MKDEELEVLWQKLSTRIETINERTKIHTLYIKEIQKWIKQNTK